MREIRSLIWKEWRETRLFLFIALGLFFSMPIIGGFEDMAAYAHRFEFHASPWVMMFGGVLAIVLGVAGTCRDLKPKLEDFWESRPIGRGRLFVVKYLVGLVVVLVACDLPLTVELLVVRDPSSAKVALAMSFLWAAIFTTAYAFGCLFRKPSHAAAVTIVAVLLIYFFPIVFPPLHRFSIGRVLDLTKYRMPAPGLGTVIDMAMATVAVPACMAVLALLTLRLRWHIESEQPLIYGAAGVAFLVLLESAAFQLGTNLPEISSVTIPSWPAEFGVRSLRVDNLSGRLIWQHWNMSKSFSWSCAGVPFTLSGNQIEVGDKHEIQLTDDSWMSDFNFNVLRTEKDPFISYNLEFSEVVTDNVETAILVVRSQSHGSSSPIELWKGPDKNCAYPLGRVVGDKMYIVGDRTMVFSISDPLHPKLLSDQPIRWERRKSVYESEEPTIDLPAFPGMPAAERLNFAMINYQIDPRFHAFDGKYWCRVFSSGSEHLEPSVVLEELRLKSLTEDAAHFELVGKRDPKLLGWVLGQRGGYIGPLAIERGFLYATQSGCVSVYSLEDSNPLQMVAHFAAPGVDACLPLEDGRAIAAGGGKLWLLGPPPKHGL